MGAAQKCVGWLVYETTPPKTRPNVLQCNCEIDIHTCSDHGSSGLGVCWEVMCAATGIWAMGLLSGDKEKIITRRREKEEEDSLKSRKAYAFAGVKGLHSSDSKEYGILSEHSVDFDSDIASSSILLWIMLSRLIIPSFPHHSSPRVVGSFPIDVVDTPSIFLLLRSEELRPMASIGRPEASNAPGTVITLRVQFELSYM